VGISQLKVKSIYLAVASPQIGGTELQIAKMASEFQQKGLIVKVLILKSRGPLNLVLERYHIETENFNVFTPNPFTLIQNLIKYFRFIKNEKPNVLYSFLAHSVIASTLTFSFWKIETLFISGIRGKARNRHPFIESVFNLCLEKSDLVICNTELIAHDMQNRLKTNKNKCHVIYNGVHIPRKIANCSKIPPQGIVVANFLPEKGYENLLKALAQIDNDCRYVFCGNGTAAQINALRTLIDRYSLQDIVELKINPANIEKLILSSQFAIHPSLKEGLSNAILEEIACGLPVIAFDVGGNSKLVENNLNGFLVAEDNEKKFVEAIREMSINSGLRSLFGKNSREIAQKFSFNLSVKSHLDLFERTFIQKFYSPKKI
jgi:glycosyltransferase involved in cell wall biosynthesis